MVNRSLARAATAALLGGVSVIGLAVPADAAHVLFSTDAALAGKDIAPGTEVIVKNGITQVELANGAVAAFVDGAQFSLRPNGVLDLRGGTVTVVSPTGAPVSVMMPGGVVGAVDGENASASFTVTAKGARGSVLGGKVAVLANGVTQIFPLGSFWSAASGRAPERVVANAPAAVPGTVRPMRDGGIAAAAENGIPVALGEALAAVGADGDIVAAARRIDAYDRNPVLTAFPRGDYGLLTSYAAQAAAPFGGVAFNGAGADIVRTYFQFLASGRQPGDFRSAYAQSLLSYLDLLRSGALPSGFTGATQAQLTAYIAFIGRTDGFGALSTTNRSLLDAYLAFLSGGGTPDGFGVRASTLVGTYLDFLRAGGDPAKFAVASASVVAQYLAILQSGGIKNQLTAANRALLDAYLASVARSGNGLAFANTAATNLAAFTAYLNGGGFPSQYSAADAVSIRAYLETLSATGLFDRVLGSQAAFLRAYLVFLQGGGSGDAFDKLPINVLTAQATALGNYYVFIQNGGTPSSYATLTQVQINDYLKALKDVGLFDALLGTNARFLSDYYAYLLQGGNPDLYAGLPNVDLTAYATQIARYVAYLKAGSLPSAYTALDLQQLRDYLNALSVSGKLATLLGGDATFLASYLAYLQGGGVPDQFNGLPIYTYTGYSTQLAAYIAYLKAGGLPSGYTALTAAQIRTYLEALQANGQLVALLGANANFFTTYLVYLQSGGSGDAFTGLPIATYTAYSSQLAAFIAYLNGGGLPSAYTTLTAAQIRSYLEALQANGQLAALLGANAGFFTSYLAYLQGGGGVDAFTGLPIVTYRSYATALSAFYVFLAGGGRPSAYTALTAAQIKTYLDVLATAGQSSTLLGNNAGFFAGYLTYLSGGGNGDQYAALPSTTVPPPTRSAQLVATGYTLGNTGNNQRAITINAANGIESFTASSGAVVARGTAEIAQSGATVGTTAEDRIYWTRWAGGKSASTDTTQVIDVPVAGGIHLLHLPPATAIPVSGTAQYTLTGGTNPTIADGSVAPGTFTGALGVDFKSAKVGIDFNVAIGGFNYAIATAGKATAPTNGGLDFVTFTNGNGAVNSYGFLDQIAVAPGGPACTGATSCTAFLTGLASGPGASAFGVRYGIQPPRGSNVAGNPVSGVAAFAGTYTAAGTVTPTPTPTATTTLGLVPTGIFTGGPSDPGVVAIGVDAQGRPTDLGIYGNPGSATLVEYLSGSGWRLGRFGDGTFGTGTSMKTYESNQSVHFAALAPLTNRPTSGGVLYNVTTATTPTFTNASAAAVSASTLTLNLGVAFGASPRFGYDGTLSLTSGGQQSAIAFTTSGGSGAPSLTNVDASNPRFGLYGTAGLTSSGGTLCASAAACRFNVNFIAGGDAASLFGAGYSVVSAPGGVALLNGAAVLSQSGTFSPAPAPAPITFDNVPGTRTAGQFLIRANSNILTNTGLSTTVTDAMGLTAYKSGKDNSDTPQRGSAIGKESGSSDNVVFWTRWADGTTAGTSSTTTRSTLNAFQGLHFVFGAPVTGLPATGIATYALVGSTKPTIVDGSLLPGSFAGSASVAFGAMPTLGVDFTVSIGGSDYRAVTAGGVTNPAISDIAISTKAGPGYGQFENYGVTVTGTGTVCPEGNCKAGVLGALAGSGASHLALDYLIVAPGPAGVKTAVSGSAAFKRPAGLSPPNAAPTGAGLTMATTGTYYYNYNDATFNVIGFNSSVTATANGQLQAGVWGSDKATLLTATNVDFGTAGGIIGWSRWTGGTAQVVTNKFDLPVDAGVSYIWGTPATAIPTTGSATYAMVGNTKPTFKDGSFAPGNVVTAGLAVAFATSQVGFSADILINGKTYTAASTGGLAAPSMSFAKDGRFNEINSNNAIQGFLAGPGGAYAGVSYLLQGPAYGITGVIAFAKRP